MCTIALKEVVKYYSLQRGRVYCGLSLMAITFVPFKSIIRICEKFGDEFDLNFNANKIMGIYFPGKRRYRQNQPTLYLIGNALSWVKSVKHLGNIVTWDLREASEIAKKRCDFTGKTNWLLANFKSVQKGIHCHAFWSQCCHMYGSQTWALDACHINIFCSTWYKAIHEMWVLSNTTRSTLVSHLANSTPIEDQLY